MKLTEYLYPALNRRHQTQCERELQRLLDDVTSECESLRKRLADTEEELEKEHVTNRIQQLEIVKLTAVCSRDLERVRQEGDVHRRGDS